jgi:hypothetical protein
MERSFFAESISRGPGKTRNRIRKRPDDREGGRAAQAGRAQQTDRGEPQPPWRRNLLEQFNQLVIWILLAATIVSGILGDWLEAGAILTIVFLNCASRVFSGTQSRGSAHAPFANSLANAPASCATEPCTTSRPRNLFGAISWSWKQAIVSRRTSSPQNVRSENAGSDPDRRIYPGGERAEAILPNESTIAERDQHGLHGDKHGRGQGDAERWPRPA